MDYQTNAAYGDFYAWLYKSAELLRQRQFSELDLEQIAEELEGMARSDKRQLINRCAVLLAHLLKWQYLNPEDARRVENEQFESSANVFHYVRR
jgi:hypothetical protein